MKRLILVGLKVGMDPLFLSNQAIGSLTPFHLIEDDYTEERRSIRLWLTKISQQWVCVFDLYLHPPLISDYISDAIGLLRMKRHDILAEQYGAIFSKLLSAAIDMCAETQSSLSCNQGRWVAEL